jgi:hypothetical protein
LHWEPKLYVNLEINFHYLFLACILLHFLNWQSGPRDDTLSQFKENLQIDLRKSLGLHFKADVSYSKPYPLYLDYMKVPDSWKVPKFLQKEHITMFLALYWVKLVPWNTRGFIIFRSLLPVLLFHGILQPYLL